MVFFFFFLIAIAQSELLRILDRLSVRCVVYVTRGRRISGFCGGLGGDQETGGKLRAAGRVRIVGKKFFRSFVRECKYSCIPEMVFYFCGGQIENVFFFFLFLVENGI